MLLKRIVDAHLEIAISPESNWIPQFHRRRCDLTRDGHVKREFIDLLVAYSQHIQLLHGLWPNANFIYLTRAEE